MSAFAQARCWTSSACATAWGLEYEYGRLSVDALCDSLMEFKDPALSKTKFLLFPLASTNMAGVNAAVSAVGCLARMVHVCLMLDEATLKSLGSGMSLPSGIGFGLDEVARETSLGAIVEASLEAVRFSHSFVTAAADDLRVGAALEAVVGLAGELGLRTLGPVFEPVSSLGRGRRFDYVPTAVAAP